ncbi:MAG TPA: DUF4190 domain-containing protein [Xanthomonadaceae bacterium]|nr:DUF4190 domain-containing protein [Xanthomonadaceae bacterium]
MALQPLPRTSTTALLSLIFGILSWCVLPLVGAVVAVVTGHVARAELRRAAPGELEGDGMAVAGLVLGWANLAVMALGLFLVLFVFGGIAWLAWLVN